MAKKLSSRTHAAQILTAVIQRGQSLTHCLHSFTANEVKPSDRSFIQELCYGVLRWYGQLTKLSKLLLSKPLKTKDQDIQNLLLLGLYQLIYLQTPAHAAVHATVQAARELNKNWATHLLNGTLRHFQRHSSELLEQLRHQAPTAQYAHPAWLLAALKSDWPAEWESIINANNQLPPFTLRINRRQYSLSDYLALVTDSPFTATPVPHAPQALIINPPQAVTALPGFSAGAFSVQDAAAQLVAPLLDLKPDLRVLDACAAPGGKTAHLLELEPKLAQVVAIDHDAERLTKVNATLQRLSLAKPEQTLVLAADAAQPNIWWDGQLFDRILLDAPCSATGVIRRHPDIKLLRRATDIAELAKTQLALLQALWPLLKPGGLLVYVTCSILPAENNEVISTFLANEPTAMEHIINASWGKALKIGRQILPGMDNMDGFYFACLEHYLS